MARLFARTSKLLVVILLVTNVPALAVDRTFQFEVENSLKGATLNNFNTQIHEYYQQAVDCARRADAQKIQK